MYCRQTELVVLLGSGRLSFKRHLMRCWLLGAVEVGLLNRVLLLPNEFKPFTEVKSYQ